MKTANFMKLEFHTIQKESYYANDSCPSQYADNSNGKMSRTFQIRIKKKIQKNMTKKNFFCIHSLNCNYVYDVKKLMNIFNNERDRESL